MPDLTCAQAFWTGVKMKDCGLQYGHGGEHEPSKLKYGFIGILFWSIGIVIWQIGLSLGWW